MSGRKIVGSAAEGLISILYCESPWAVSWSPPTQKWRMAAREGREGGRGREMEERLQRARRGMRKVKEDSFTKTGMVLRVRRKGGKRTGEVLEGSRLPPWNQAVWGNWVQVQRQSPRLNDEVMKTKWILSYFKCVYVNSPRPPLSQSTCYMETHRRKNPTPNWIKQMFSVDFCITKDIKVGTKSNVPQSLIPQCEVINLANSVLTFIFTLVAQKTGMQLFSLRLFSQLLIRKCPMFPKV